MPIRTKGAHVRVWVRVRAHAGVRIQYHRSKMMGILEPRVPNLVIPFFSVDFCEIAAAARWRSPSVIILLGGSAHPPGVKLWFWPLAPRTSCQESAEITSVLHSFRCISLVWENTQISLNGSLAKRTKTSSRFSFSLQKKWNYFQFVHFLNEVLLGDIR